LRHFAEAEDRAQDVVEVLRATSTASM
jgi:hypothetical protein